MLQKLKDNKNKIIAHFISGLFGIVVVSALGMFEALNPYMVLMSYVLGLVGHNKLVTFFEKKLN